MNQDKFIINTRQLFAGKMIDDEETVHVLIQNECYYFLTQSPLGISFDFDDDIVRKQYEICRDFFVALKDIPYAVVNGAVLSQQIYNIPAYRNTGKIDLLIAPEDIGKLKNIFEKYGFVQGYTKNNVIVPCEKMLSFVKKNENDTTSFVQVDVILDIFWTESDYKVDMREFLSHGLSYMVYDVNIRKLDPVYELIYLCMNCYKEYNSLYLLAERRLKLAPLFDIYYYITKINPDLKQLKEVCDSLNVAGYVKYCVIYSNCFFGDNLLWGIQGLLDPEGFLRGSYRYGLSDDEYKYPGFSVTDYILDDSLTERFLSCLTEKDWKKIKCISDK